MDNSELRPKLERAKETLRSALEEACRADVENVDTGELIRIEEVLAIGNDAAKEAISLRRRLKTKGDADVRSGSEPEGTREIVDDRGVQWTIFAVHPTA